MVPKVLEEIHPADVQVEDSDEGGIGMLFGINQAIEVDKLLSANHFLETSDQNKFRSVVEWLAN